MPEFPEVYTISQQVQSILKQHAIIAVHGKNCSLRKPLHISTIRDICQDQKLKQILQQGKYMLWRFSNQKSLLVHLGMSGRFRLVSAQDIVLKHDHIRWELSDGQELRYYDPRKFGLVYNANGFPKLGINPIDQISPNYLLQHAQQHSTWNMKKFLVCQEIIAGIGNIYANEILFSAMIHPERLVISLNIEDWRSIIKIIAKTIKLAMKHGGTTLKDKGFSDIFGKPGNYQNFLKVYDRKNQKCNICHTIIQTLEHQSPTTYYCSTCQVF